MRLHTPAAGEAAAAAAEVDKTASATDWDADAAAGVGQPRKLGVFERVQIQSRDWRAAPGKELLLTSEWALLCRSSPTTAISAHGVAAVVGSGEEILANRESSESLNECKFNREIGEPHLVRSSSCPVRGRC